MKKTVVTSSTTESSSESESPERKRSLVEMQAKGQPAFPRHDVKMFARDGYSMSSESFSYKSVNNNNHSSVYERSITTKTIGGGDENRIYLEHFTKSSDDEQPIVVMVKGRSQIGVPDWLEERKSPEKERRDVDSNICVFLKYPLGYSPTRVEPRDRANESRIRPEVAKRDKQEIPVLLDEDHDKSDEQIVVVMRDRSQIGVPDWLEERKSPGTQRRDVAISNINVFLRYPRGYSPRKGEPRDRANESRIRPEVAKRDKQEIPVLPDEDDGKGKSDEQIVVVMRNTSQFDVPDWLEERESPGTQRRDVDISNINVFLRYPRGYSPRKVEPRDRANESWVRPEVAKRDKQQIPVIPDEDEDEEESDEEYDEFEEEIVVMNVRRNPIWRKGLEIPKPQPQKAGLPIEDLLEIPTLQTQQESTPDELLIDEKIESVERSPVVFAEFPDLGILDNL